MSDDKYFPGLRHSLTVEDMMVPVCIDLVVVSNSKISEFPLLEKVLQVVVQDALQKFEKEGFRSFLHSARVRPMSQEELISIVPRKVHYAPDDIQVCDTAHVSKKNLTKDREKVTCRLCIRKMEPPLPTSPPAGPDEPAPAPRPAPASKASSK